MRILSPALVLCLAGIGCTMRTPKSSLSSEDKLSSIFFTIDPTHDTSLITPKGAKMAIAAGSFEGTGPVRLEVKEAYTIGDILAGGLVTTSKGQLLSSGGMIYINAADGKAVKIGKPI